MDDYVVFELDAAQKGWRCSGCGLRVDAIGRPIFGKEMFIVTAKGTAWIENRPIFVYCPQCGKKVSNYKYIREAGASHA